MNITLESPKALFFDVFGTLVDWRSTIGSHLSSRCDQALNDDKLIPTVIRSKIEDISWTQFTELWRESYSKFTASYEPGRTAYKTIDEHHLDSMKVLIKQYGVDALWTDEEVEEINSSPGLSSLKSLGFQTLTLSNGNIALLKDLCEYASLPFTVVTSAEEFGAYKPNPLAYLGACKKLHFEPRDCYLVAAHLGDLQAAKALGLRTIYVERFREETWSADSVKKARDEGWVDLWIELGSREGGLKEVARIFQIEEVGKEMFEKE